MIFKEKLKEIRTSRKITQQQLADKLGIRQTAISAWERGYYEPSIARLKRIAEVLECTVSELVGNGRTYEISRGVSDVEEEGNQDV